MKYLIGIEIERTQLTDCLVEVEATSEEEARKKARHALTLKCSKARSTKDLFARPNAVEWEDSFYSVYSDSKEEFDPNMYSPDCVVP